MNRRRGQLQGYFAGIFDGEGHVGIHRQDSRSYQLKVCVQMDDPQAVLLLWKEYPEAVITYHMEKKFWKVALNQHKAKRFLEELIPYMIIKRTGKNCPFFSSASCERTYWEAIWWKLL